MHPVIPRLNTRNRVGLCHLDVVDVREVVSVPDEVEGNIAGNVTLADDSTWSRVQLDDDNGLLDEVWEMVQGSPTARCSVQGLIPKDRLELLPALWKLHKNRYLVLATTRNGDRLLLGTKEEPAQVRVARRALGEEMTDRNVYYYQVEVERRSPVPFYLGTAAVTSTPSSPGAGTLTEVDGLEDTLGAPDTALMELL